MKVKDKILYHFHKKGIHDSKWYVDGELTIDNKFNNDLLDILNDFNTAVNTTDGDRVSFDEIITNYLNEKALKKEYEKMLKECILIIEDTNLFTQEKNLEDVRKEFFENYPSRKHSIFLLDKDNIKYWYNKLSEGNRLDLYKVSLSGNLFKFNVKYLPKGELTYKENTLLAKKYWNSENEDAENTEYLFQGKIKILEKLDIEYD